MNPVVKVAVPVQVPWRQEGRVVVVELVEVEVLVELVDDVLVVDVLVLVVPVVLLVLVVLLDGQLAGAGAFLCPTNFPRHLLLPKSQLPPVALERYL